MALDRSIVDELNTRGPARVLSTSRIVFLVVAAAAPIGAMVGTTPLALTFGNGAALPAAYLIAGLTLLCFAVGYAAMGRRIVNTGAFYTYVSHGLGKPPAVAAAYLAVLSYTALTIGLYAAFGYFTTLITDEMGMKTPWLLWSAIAVAVVGFLGYRSVDLSAKVLGVLVALEVAILLVLDVAILVRDGGHALPLESFSPSTVFHGGISSGVGLMLMFAYVSFIGFESAALYGEEARDPTRSIPRATYAAVVLIGVFYLMTTWLVVGGIGAANTSEVARREEGNLLFWLATDYAGEAVSGVMGILLCSSLVASALALHNAASRYLFALGRERLLPRPLGNLHPRRYAPSLASLVQTGVGSAVIVAFALAGMHPYFNLATSVTGIGTLGVLTLQGLAAVAVVGYFRRVRDGGDLWRTTFAPGIAVVSLTAVVLLVFVNYSSLTGTDNVVVDSLPILVPLLILGGVGYGLWLRRHRPAVYAALAHSRLRGNQERQARVIENYAGRYCVVGGGPAGLVVGRALRQEGIEYDQFERHSDIGGIWDLTNPGSPMYSTAHFISSRYTSGFFGHPMPADLPDYPNHRQILAFIRDFADAYGLRGNVTLGVGVERAEPVGPDARDGWSVRLSTGEVRRYAGLVCCNGVNWHPRVPEYEGLADFQGEVRHSATYRDPAELAGRRVLIVGGGNSGVDIASDAARVCSAAFLSLRRGYRFVPKHLFGVPTDAFIYGEMRPPKGVVLPDDPTRMLDALVGDLTRLGLAPPDHKLLQSHPIVNTQVLHHLAHGHLTAKRDVLRFTATGAVFADGSEETVDLVLFATGYEHRVPYLDEAYLARDADGRSPLYLRTLHRRLHRLAVVGAIELAGPAYKTFDEMAGLVTLDAYLAESGGADLDRWLAMKATDDPDLRGGVGYLDSPRHLNYVEVATFRRVISERKAMFGWPDPAESTYDSQRRTRSAPVPVA